MAPGRIVVVEDDDAIGRGVVEALRLDGYAADRAVTGSGALEAVAGGGADLVVVDLDLGDGSAGELCRVVKQWEPVPSVLALVSERAGTRVGVADVADADDYVRKPFALADLRARVRLQLRPDLVARGRVVAGDLELDRPARRAWLRGRPLALRPKEVDLLAFLLAHAGRAVPRHRILEAVWGRTTGAPSKTLDVHVSMLRRKLGDDAGTRIVTVRGIGYRYDPFGGGGGVSGRRLREGADASTRPTPV